VGKSAPPGGGGEGDGGPVRGESATLGDCHTVPQRHALIATLLAAKRQVAGAPTNLNQLTKMGHSSGEVPGDVVDVARKMEAAVGRLENMTERPG
jgi:hypothetical protein